MLPSRRRARSRGGSRTCGRRWRRTANPEEVAHFLMRCLFTMFAEDVELLPEDGFTGLLEECVRGPRHLPAAG